jgi:glycosyltransferase involved in cell wall biosynthesis
MTLISVITPSFNQAEFIEDTLRSVRRQSHEHVAHHVIDGKSDDGTISILEQHNVDWISEDDDGQADAINKGFDRASGEIIGWLNSDDVYFDVDVLSRVAMYFERYDADIIYGDIAWLDAHSNVLKFWAVPPFDYEMLRRYCFIGQPAVFFRKHVVKETSLNTSLETANDYEFWLRLGKKYTFRHVSDVLAGDRNHPRRKSIAMRNQLQIDTQKIQKQYGGQTTYPTHLRLSDLATTGIQRGLRSLYWTFKHNNKPRKLAFDGQLRPLSEMSLNVFYPNRRLV